MLGIQNGAQLGSNYQQSAANSLNGPIPVSEAESILDRLRDLRSKMHDIVGSFRIANDKIVGPAPEKMPPPNGGAGQIAPNPQGFLHSSSQIISDIDAVSSDIAEQLSRLHRSF